MPLATVPLYAGLLGLLLIVLSWRVVRLRHKHRVNLGDDGVADLQRAIRVHGNFVEYVPLILILLAALELTGKVSTIVLHSFGAALVIGRILHAQGLAASAGVSFGRQAGTALTWVTLLGVSLYLLISSYFL